MVFNSYIFVCFLVLNLALYWTLTSWKLRKLQLLTASYLFYAAWNPPFVLLLLFSTTVDYLLGRKLETANNETARKLLLTLSLLVNLGVLAWFKYASFFLASFTASLSAVGIDYAPPQLDIILPVGISFYTFQTLSYTIDLYRGRIKACTSLLDFAIFVSFFPQLVAGPIVRAREFLYQLRQPPVHRWPHWDWGMTLVIIGLFEKVVLADSLLGRMADSVYGSSAAMSTTDAWMGTIAFAWQILFDFAGYSTIAIGVAMLFGFALPRNFHWPYAASGFSDFWQRWHISLSSWLRDYLYIPLGGNRRSSLITCRNLMFTMLLGGLWHGAAWTFVVWGGLHGIFLIVERLARRSTMVDQLFAKGWGIPLTFPLICIAWVFFRAVDVAQAMTILRSMLTPQSGLNVLSRSDIAAIGCTTFVGLAISIMFRRITLEQVWSRTPRLVAMAILVTMALATFLSPGDDRAFIYFQF